MIPAQLLHRLVQHIADHYLERAELQIGDCAEQPSRAARRERLEDFAGMHDLDLEDTATLFRVAAGEAPDTRRDKDQPRPGRLNETRIP